MGRAITRWAAENSGEKLSRVSKLIEVENPKNVYDAVSKFFINNEAPARLSSRTSKIVDHLVAFLMAVEEHADEISEAI